MLYEMVILQPTKKISDSLSELFKDRIQLDL